MSESPTRDARLPSKAKLKALVAELTTNQGKAEAASGRNGSLISAAVEKDNVHREALSWLRRQLRKDPVKLHAYFAHMDKYREDFELDKIAGDVLPLDENVDPKARTKDKRGSTKRKAKGAAAEAGADGDKGSGGGTVTTLDQRRAERKAAAPEK